MAKIESIKSNLSDLYQQITGAAKEAKEQIQRLDNEIETRVKERHALSSAPLTKADFLEQFRSKVRMAGDSHAMLLKYEIDKLERSVHYASRPDAGFDFLLAGRGLGNQQISQISLCYFFEEAIVQGVERACLELEWPDENAPTLAAMTARMSDLDAEINKFEAERESYVQVLKSFKIVS